MSEEALTVTPDQKKRIDEDLLGVDIRALRSLINAYVDHVSNIFETHKNDEDYKFRDVKTFKENFDLSSLDAFKEKIERALPQSSNLLTSGKYYARRVFIDFLKIDEKFVYGEVRRLIDESKDVVARINDFCDSFENKRVELLGKGLIDERYRQTYIDYRFVSYLLSAYMPEKYIYTKYTEYENFLHLC